MLRGLYTAAAGMMSKQLQVDVVANNLANVNTTGYKREETVLASFPEKLIARIHEKSSFPRRSPVALGSLGTGCVVAGIITEDSTGSLVETGSQFDLALKGDAYFVVADASGKTFYTRNGSFLLTQDNKLITGEGLAVLGEVNGRWEEIYLPGGGLKINQEGFLTGAQDQNGHNISKLALVSGPAAGEVWKRQGDSLFIGSGVSQPSLDYQVKQGFKEAANVNAIQEMVNLLSAYRAYEANQKVIQTLDTTLEKAVNEIGRV